MADAAVQRSPGIAMRTPQKAKGAAGRNLGSASKKASSPQQKVQRQTPQKAQEAVSQAGQQEPSQSGLEEDTEQLEQEPRQTKEQFDVGDQEEEGNEEDNEGEVDYSQMNGTREEVDGVEDEVDENAQEEGEQATNAVSQRGENAEQQIDGAVEGQEGQEDEEGQEEEGEGQEGEADEQQNEEQAADQGAEGQDESDSVIAVGRVVDDNLIKNDDGVVIGKVVEGNPEVGAYVDQQGDIIRESTGEVIGKAEPNDEGAASGDRDVGEDTLDQAEDKTEDLPKPDFQAPLSVLKNGEVRDANDQLIARVSEEEAKKLQGKEIQDIDTSGNLLDKNNRNIGKADLLSNLNEDAEEAEGAAEEGAEEAEGAVEEGAEDAQEQAENAEESAPLDYSILEGLKPNKAGNVIDPQSNTVIGFVAEGSPKDVAGRTCDAEGYVYNDVGKKLGRIQPIPEEEREGGDEEEGPFANYSGATVTKSGDVVYEGETIGRVVSGDPKKLANKQVDADGEIVDKNGTVLGTAERLEEEEQEAPPEIDYSILEGLQVNKSGNIVSDKGQLVGRVIEGDIKKLQGKKVYKDGLIWNDSGVVIGKAEPIPSEERDENTEEGPFEDYEGAIVQKSGEVLYGEQIIGRVVEGDPAKLQGKIVDSEGDICDKWGTVLGKAERWEPEEPEPEPEADLSILAGKKVNKMGYLVDDRGSKYGQVSEGDPKKLVGKKSDGNGAIWDDAGRIVGRAELLPDSERDNEEEEPFADFQPCHVRKDGMVVDANDTVVGKLVSGDAQALAGKAVDPSGDILDRNGNVLATAVRHEEEEAEKYHHPCAGLKVNREGFVFSSEGEKLAQLTEGTLSKCAGRLINEDGAVVDGKENVIGWVTMMEDVVQEKSEEEIQREKEEEEKAKQAKSDEELANRISGVIEDSIEKIRPILKRMEEAIEEAEKTPEKERDEQKLVDTVKPLLEQGHQILQETNGTIRGMDPDGRIQQNAKQKSKTKEATPAEYHLAEQLKVLSSDITECIEKCKRKISGMPKAKKQLSPLWYLLQEPLFQILAAVGLLLSGVLGLVGKLLGGLGLGNLVSGLLGGLGLDKVVEGLGLGDLLGGGGGKKK